MLSFSEIPFSFRSKAGELEFTKWPPKTPSTGQLLADSCGA